MFWHTLWTTGEDKAELLAFLDKGIINTSYFALSAMLEHRAHAIYGCVSTFLRCSRNAVDKFAICKKTSADMLDGNADGVVLIRCASRLFEDISKAERRRARHYSSHLLCDVVSAVLQHGWFDASRED